VKKPKKMRALRGGGRIGRDGSREGARKREGGLLVRGEEREGEEALHCNGQGVKHPGVTVPTGARRITTITKKYHNHHKHDVFGTNILNLHGAFLNSSLSFFC
jgi:hypothetical protein